MTDSPRVLDRDRARSALVHHHHLHKFLKKKAGAADLLNVLRMIQLDPLDPMGTNADLVAMARLPGIKKGAVYNQLLPRHAFEHYAKEHCLIQKDGFPYYRAMVKKRPDLRTSKKLRDLSPALLRSVERELKEHGPLRTAEFQHRGKVPAESDGSWKSSSTLTTLALRRLWLQCRAVVIARDGKDKVWAAPSAVFPDLPRRSARQFSEWALLERVQATGLLCENVGPTWGCLRDVRKGSLVEQLIKGEQLERVRIDGDSRSFLTSPGFASGRSPPPDSAMRILGPLDPLIWDRALVRTLFGFDYIWEVYKPKSERKFGWYVCPLLSEGELVGRLEGRLKDEVLTIDWVLREPRQHFDKKALRDCVERHAQGLGARDFRLGPVRVRR